MRRLGVVVRGLLGGFAALALALVFAGPADAAVGISGKPKVSFFAAGSPGALDIEGASSDLRVSDDGTMLVFTVAMASVHTGIDMRDEHMNAKFVEIGKFPDAILTVGKADILWPMTLAEAKTGTANATFNIHGADQPVTLEYTIQKSKTGHRVRTKFSFDVTKSGIAIPDYLGITVDPKMHAQVTVDLIDA